MPRGAPIWRRSERSSHGGARDSPPSRSRSGSGDCLPALLDSSSAPFIALGIGFAVLALSFIVYGTLRQRQVDRAIAKGSFRPLDGWFVLALTSLMVILVATTIVLILMER